MEIPTSLYRIGRRIVINKALTTEIAKYLPDTGSILDIGCGYGTITNHLATMKKQARFIGIDINGKRIDEADKHRQSNVEFYATNALDYFGVGMSTYDAIILVDVLHHIPSKDDVTRLLVSCMWSLTPGGNLVIKDIDPTRVLKTLFTRVMDILISRENPTIRQYGHYLGYGEANYIFKPLKDILPYPHYLLVLKK